MIIQKKYYKTYVLLPVKDCRGLSLISYIDVSSSLRFASWQVVVIEVSLITITNRGDPQNWS